MGIEGVPILFAKLFKWLPGTTIWRHLTCADKGQVKLLIGGGLESLLSGFKTLSESDQVYIFF